jgi:hypothetical protein
MTISAKIIADSVSTSGKRITTYELEYPRFIHAEFMTHRLFSRNAASSRAIPVERAIELIKQNTAMPIHWGKNQPGMSAKEECDTFIAGRNREEWWKEARDVAIGYASAFGKVGYHKQIVNRLLEPYSHIKVVCTATEFDNFFYLRRHPDAQPEIQELANQMWETRNQNTPNELYPGEWHVPYYGTGFWMSAGPSEGEESDQFGVTLNEAIAISASCCAQVSYRRLDDSLEKALEIYNRLITSKPAHASPFEHQATPMVEDQFREDDQVLLYTLPDNDTLDSSGITHFDRYGYAWSGNFRGWIQNRQLIVDHVCMDYQP